ncbi:uncharacterized protein LOC113508077, partial [Trichoplusia ni]|uniref:Uncharacterized protein LOC113508077 n=1 Tax=Trichoplusia ni TaxID=7111 RepID=A0A7E5X0Z5_TRINI
MEKYANLQSNLNSIIEKSRCNFKKTPKDRLCYQYIDARLEKLEKDWQAFCKNHYEILELDSATVTSLECIVSEVYEATEEIYINYKSELKIALSKYPAPRSDTPVCKNTQDNSVPMSSNSSVRLPKITIPSFSGKYSEWTSFRDLFISLVHSNQSLDSVQKLHYLKAHLTGEAEQLIKFVPIAAANYNQCWTQLESRYNNKRYLSNCILKRLFSQRNSNVESASTLKELLDTTTECLHALKNLEIDVSSWDIIIIHIVTYKLDPDTRKQWELHVTSDHSNELPTFDQFSKFLESRFRALEFIEPKSKSVPSTTSQTKGHFNKPKVFHVSNQAITCEYCSDYHKLCFCKKFAKIDYDQKHDFVMKNHICFNCLGSNHSVKQCQKTMNCRLCNRRHHSLLHPNNSSATTVAQNNSNDQVTKVNPSPPVAGSSSKDTSPIVSCFSSGNCSQVLLATALVNAESKFGGKQVIRALIDQGSQASFITEATVQTLGLKKVHANSSISGVGSDSTVTSRSVVSLKIQSRVDPSFEIIVRAYVLKSITTLLPRMKISELQELDLHTITLADPQYNRPNKIHILLGAEIYCQIIQQGLLKGVSGTPVAQCTSLGWILSGLVSNKQTDNTENKLVVMNATVNEDEVLKRFWELESDYSSISQKMLTEEQQKCEEYFNSTTRRAPDGRYVVRLPFREADPACKYGRSREIAENRLKSLERKLHKNEEMKKRYTDVIKEYLHLGHMIPVPENDDKQSESVYLPHHAVIREDKSTTKVRVVFDASCKGLNGVSLNDTLLIGPQLQPELRHLIIRWRIHPICLAADIIKMYRQVRVHDDDTVFQRILWRDKPEDSVQEYQLLTVTFGTASAPYLAVKALQQVALDEGDNYPEAAKKILEDFYMDDLMSGCETVEDGIKLFKEINMLLNKGGFKLQKWTSNDERIIKEINLENKEQDLEQNLEIKLDYIMKILGLTWNRRDDIFQYSVKLTKTTGPETKRSVISNISRLFDPLGWLAPALITAKVFIQKLWLAGISWDEEIPNQLLDEWHTYCNELSQLTEFKIPRWLGTKASDITVDLYGFSDASKVAYSAAVYLRRVDVNGNVLVSLVAAKTRVAPIKQISIPRLELCGAVLVTRLLVEMAEVLNIPKANLRAWTDSTVVLAWLNKHPSYWKTFIANRVSEILTTLDASQWAHIPSSQNPADCASRGIRPVELVDN